MTMPSYHILNVIRKKISLIEVVTNYFVFILETVRNNLSLCKICMFSFFCQKVRARLGCSNIFWKSN